MGCGSSSLKGDAPNDLGPASRERPMKEIRGKFESVDYDSPASEGRRQTIAAPNEIPGPKKPSRQEEQPVTPASKLQPYHTEDTNALGGNEVKDMTYPHEGHGLNTLRGTTDADADPTSLASKEAFARNNDPSSRNNLAAPAPAESQGRKQSWFGKQYQALQDAKVGRNADGSAKYSDEDMKKYTGMNREELKQWAKDKPVGGNARAGTNLVGDMGGLGGMNYHGYDNHRHADSFEPSKMQKSGHGDAAVIN